ncbi:hypothetical protein ACPZ19_07660 [Amycolatopsis lurida]
MSPKSPEEPSSNGKTLTAYRSPTGRTVSPPAVFSGATTKSRPPCRSSQAVSIARRRPFPAAATPSPQWTLVARSASVTNHRRPSAPVAIQW